MSTIVNRHCKDCANYEKTWSKSKIGWCYWLDTLREGSSYECKDGFKK